MEKEVYEKEGVDFKRLFLLFIRKLWLPVLMTAVGIGAGALIYEVVVAMTSGEPRYRISSDYYITFNFSEYENSTDYYNAYTWDGILRDDPVVDYAMDILPDSVSKERVKAAVSGEMLGDYRILTVNVIDTDPEVCEEIAYAYTESLAHFAEKIDMLKNVELWSREEITPVKEDNRIANAAFLGGLLGFLVSLFWLLIWYLLDDAIYVETDFIKRYNIPFLGTITNHKDEKCLKELQTNYRYLCRDTAGYYAVNVVMSDTIENPCVPILMKYCTGILGELPLKGENFERLRESAGVILLLPYGKTNGKLMVKMLHMLEKQDCKVAGAVLTDADDHFLKAYYLGRKE